MAVPANAVQTFAMVGIKEDLSDTITMLNTHEFPLQAMIAKGRCNNRNPEWQIDSYRAADPQNAAIEGDDVAADAMGQPSKLRNYVQLYDTTVAVSSTSQAVNAAGRNPNEMARLAEKSVIELKGDMEMRIGGNYASVAGAAGAAGKHAGMLAWLTTNTDRGVAGANGGFNSGTGLVAAATAGTNRAVTEVILKSVIKKVWDSGGVPAKVLVDSTQKQSISQFTGIATKYNQVVGTERATIIGAADVYVSDFGHHTVIPSRFAAANNALVIDPSGWELLFLQPFAKTPLAKTGHSDKVMLSAELTLRCWNEKKNGVAADLT